MRRGHNETSIGKQRQSYLMADQTGDGPKWFTPIQKLGDRRWGHADADGWSPSMESMGVDKDAGYTAHVCIKVKIRH